jgi:predicted nucleotidyltransferase
LEFEKKDQTIFDIIIYGSAVKGKEKPRDIDILIIFLEGSLRERLDIIQEIKSKVKRYVANADIKQILLKELFSVSFLARTSIFLEGISVFNKKKFCETLGFESFTLFWYTLEGLTHTQKVKFNYILAGRGMKGVIEDLNGERIANGAIKIPIENSLVFEGILKANRIVYKKKNILEEK